MRAVTAGLVAMCTLSAEPLLGSDALGALPSQPPPQTIHDARAPDILIPADSPLRFRSFEGEGGADFTGTFVLAGTFAYWCEIGDCPAAGELAGPLTDEKLELDVIPEPSLAARLPHPVGSEAPVKIMIEQGGALAKSLVSEKDRAALKRGAKTRLTGRVAIVADHFHIGFDCDSVWYSAHFVRMAKPATATAGLARLDEVSGCA